MMVKTSSFDFHPHDATIRGRVHFRSLPGFPRRDFFVFLPHSATSRSPVVALVHGITRNAAELIFRFSREADRLGAILIAPLFERKAFGQYQQVVDGRKKVRADLALIDMLKAVGQETGVPHDRLYLFGYSGGAQFAHRFMMLHPEKVHAIAVAAAGWYTMPDPDFAYPYGIGSHPLSGQAFDVDRFVAIPRHLLVGSEDTARGESLRTSDELDQLQGPNRLERAKRWFDAMQRTADERGIGDVPAIFTRLPGSGHSFTSAARKHDLAATVLRHFDFSTNLERE
jgi:pimeloyl-ACP methyl ester carboxylesterase